MSTVGPDCLVYSLGAVQTMVNYSFLLGASVSPS